VCFFVEVDSADPVFPGRGVSLKWREVSELSQYDNVLCDYKMTHTLFFPHLVDEQRLKESLAKALAAYPSFASKIVERNGKLFLDWGETKGVPFSVALDALP